MKLGLLSSILPNMEFRQVVDLSSRIGFQALEVACWPLEVSTRRYAGVTHLDIDSLGPDGLVRELDYAGNKNISVSALGYYPNPMSHDKQESVKAQEHIKKLIIAAGKSGVGMVGTFIGRDRYKNVEENLAEYSEVWQPIIELAEKENVKVAVENCPMLFSSDEWPGGDNLASSPAIWNEMFRLIPSDKLGLNYDPSHCVILDMDYLKPLLEYKNKIFHVHLKDTKVYRDKLDHFGRLSYPLNYMSPKLPGLGDINWGDFYSTLCDIGYTGVACIEVEDRNFEEDEDMIIKGIEIAYKNVCNYF